MMVAVFTLISLAVLDSWALLPALLLVSTLFGLVAAALAVAIGSARPHDTISLAFSSDFDALVDELTQLGEPERAALKARAARLVGASAQILDIGTGPQFKRTMARFLSRQLVVVVAVDLAALLVWMAFLLGISALLVDHPALLAAWYGRQAAALMALSACALVAYNFWGFLLHRLGDIVGPPVAAAIAGSIVPVGKFLVTGRLEFAATTAANTFVAAAVGLFGAQLGEAAKRQDRRSG
jgi:hypothetical protein